MTEYPFVDPISGLTVTLVVNTGAAQARMLTVRHPVPGEATVPCPSLADVSPDLDAFYCTGCKRSGRLSGAWALDMLEVEPDPSARARGDASPAGEKVRERRAPA